MEPCKVCVEKSDQIREILRPFQLEHVDPVGGVRLLGKSLAEARAQVAALTAERDAAKAELAAAKQDTARLVVSARDLTDAMETCHQCQSVLLVNEGPTYCSDSLCSPHCDEHAEPACVGIDVLHANLKRLLAARAPEGTPPPATEMRCVICKDPAVYHTAESAWRHKNTGLEGGQSLCEKYGYPIEVETAEGTEGKERP